MSPRRGGEADKLGNHYEVAWTVLQLLEVLAGRADSVTVEELGEIGEGVEFTLRRHNGVETHQVKRQHGSANYWKLGALRSEGVLETARRQVAAGRQFHFISTIPAQDLNDLAERTRHSPGLQTFVNSLAQNKAVKTNFARSRPHYHGTRYQSSPACLRGAKRANKTSALGDPSVALRGDDFVFK